MRVRRRTVRTVLVVLGALVTGACTPGAPDRAGSTTAGSSLGGGSTASTVAVSSSNPGVSGVDPVADLGALVIDDRPSPDRPYDRDEWPHWADVDGDGCDARQQSLIAHSIGPAQVDPFGCTVVTGDWVSAYDGVETSNPGDLDIDHVVPLEDAHVSGGWQWDAARRRAFANDQANLLPVTASSNRSKGSRTPDEWRPPVQASWCDLARTWVRTKVAWGLTATTSERDALGQMLDTCA